MERAGAILGLELDPRAFASSATHLRTSKLPVEWVPLLSGSPPDFTEQTIFFTPVNNDLLHAGADVVLPSLEDPIPGLEAR
jgi:hypothetical protein